MIAFFYLANLFKKLFINPIFINSFQNNCDISHISAKVIVNLVFI